jgi:hypothetical protein
LAGEPAGEVVARPRGLGKRGGRRDGEEDRGAGRQLLAKRSTGVSPMNLEAEVNGEEGVLRFNLTEAVPDSAWDKGWTVAQSGPYSKAKGRILYMTVKEDDKGVFKALAKVIYIRKK